MGGIVIPRAANSRVNLGLLGTGRRGLENLTFAARTSGFQITHVCDTEPEALDRARSQALRLGFDGVKSSRDFREVLADPALDAVCVSVPHHWRARMTTEACRAGKDVYVETPLFASLEEGSAAVEAARQHGRIVQAGSTWRSSSLWQQVRTIVRSGQLGDVAFCRTWGGLADIVPFAFDEGMPVSVSAQRGMMTYRYPGFTGSCEGSGRRATSICGSAATLTVASSGYRICPSDGPPSQVEQVCAQATMDLTHWSDWLHCIHTRQRPAGEIESCIPGV